MGSEVVSSAVLVLLHACQDSYGSRAVLQDGSKCCCELRCLYVVVCGFVLDSLNLEVGRVPSSWLWFKPLSMMDGISCGFDAVCGMDSQQLVGPVASSLSPLSNEIISVCIMVPRAPTCVVHDCQSA